MTRHSDSGIQPKNLSRPSRRADRMAASLSMDDTPGQAGFQIAPVRKMIFVIAKVNDEGDADLFQVGEADRLLPFLFRTGERWQQQRSQNGDNGDDHQQLN